VRVARGVELLAGSNDLSPMKKFHSISHQHNNLHPYKKI
jgi:hypothetical protein